MQIIDGIPVWGLPVDEGALKQIKTCYYIFGNAAMMADHHKGYGVPIGGVIAHETLISPSGVGFDIGCGNKAVKTDLRIDNVIKDQWSKIMDDIWATISFGIGQKNGEKVDHAVLCSPVWNEVSTGVGTTAWKLSSLKDLASQQLGTVGSGNHFVDILADEEGCIWIGVHFGSRGFGHKVATHFLQRAGGKDDMDSAPVALRADSDEGSKYIAAMELAGAYASAGRDWVCARVLKLLGAKEIESIHNHHNYAWREQHGGRDLWVVRKGATPAFPGQRGFIGGSMGDQSVIVEGVEHSDSPASFYSTVHGAGRVMGRAQAKGKVSKQGIVTREPLVTLVMMQKWLQESFGGVILRGGGVDESPHCYKRLPEVLAQQSGIKVLHTLTPIGVCMAGSGEFDPYKD